MGSFASKLIHFGSDLSAEWKALNQSRCTGELTVGTERKVLIKVDVLLNLL